MKIHGCYRWNKEFHITLWFFILTLLIPRFASAQPQPVTVTVSDNGKGASLSPRFLGLSYETAMVLPQHGHYYFSPNDQALVNTFKTLGVKSLRVGGNSVDNPRIPVPQGNDINELFNFARAAGVKVIYSFRLKKGDPAESARLAAYIAGHDADALDCFSIGNEPNFYLKTFDDYFAQWKPQYDAILKAVPSAMFDGPSVAGKDFYVDDLVKAIFPEGHLAMASNHYYFLGSGEVGAKDPAATRARFLSDRVHARYERDYTRVGKVLAAQGVPYRIDEMNSCYHGGAKNSSDTFASTLWALDCTHWWAAHHILGVNYHTGESEKRDGRFAGANYAAFVHQQGGHGFTMRPQAYAMLAFTEGAHGRSIKVKTKTHGQSGLNFNAYAYRDHDNSIYVTLINKSYADKARLALVSLRLPTGMDTNVWQRMDLVQKDSDVAAKSDVMLGGATVNPQGIWAGRWERINGKKPGHLTVQVAPASATILHFYSAK